MDVWTIVSAALGLISVIAGGFWLKAKGKLSQIKALVKEGYDVIQVAIDSVADDKITKEEAEAVKKEAQEFTAAFKALIGK